LRNKSDFQNNVFAEFFKQNEIKTANPISVELIKEQKAMLENPHEEFEKRALGKFPDEISEPQKTKVD
jgi:hypothetical protein